MMTKPSTPWMLRKVTPLNRYFSLFRHFQMVFWFCSSSSHFLFFTFPFQDSFPSLVDMTLFPFHNSRHSHPLLGKVVQEFDTQGMALKAIIPESHQAQSTPSKTFIALNNMGFFRVDSRTPTKGAQSGV